MENVETRKAATMLSQPPLPSLLSLILNSFIVVMVMWAFPIRNSRHVLENGGYFNFPPEGLVSIFQRRGLEYHGIPRWSAVQIMATRTVLFFFRLRTAENASAATSEFFISTRSADSRRDSSQLRLLGSGHLRLVSLDTEGATCCLRAANYKSPQGCRHGLGLLGLACMDLGHK